MSELPTNQNVEIDNKQQEETKTYDRPEDNPVDSQSQEETQAAREQAKTKDLETKYANLSADQRKDFVSKQQEANQIIAQIIKGGTQTDDLLRPEEQWILNKAKDSYEKAIEQNPNMPLTIQFSKQIDKTIYQNLVNRLALELLSEKRQLGAQKRANEIRKDIGIPGQPLDTTELKLLNSSKTESSVQNQAEEASVPRQEINATPDVDDEKSIIDQEAKKRTEQQRFKLAAGLLANYFDSKSNISNLLTEAEISQLEPIKRQYQQNIAKHTGFTISLGSLSPELRKLIVEDLPALFMESNIFAIERAKQQREGVISQPTVATPTPELRQQEPRTVEKVEWQNVKRSIDVIAIGDLFGSTEALQGNLEAAGAAKTGSDGKLQWTGSDKKVIFLGDIAGDRQVHGLDDLIKIRELNSQAEKAGGSIDVLVGNHDDFLVSFLMDTEGGGQADAWLSCKMGGYNGLLELCRFGSPELKSLDINSFNNLDSAKRDHVWSQLKAERAQILQNMRDDPDGQKVLEALCTMKIATVKDDSLFCHTDPTLAMMRTLLVNGSDKLEKTVELINEVYQKSLREYLIEGKPVSEDQTFCQLKDIFLDTNNRDAFWKADQIRLDKIAVDNMVSKIRESGINGIIHGHSPDYPQSMFAPKDLLITSVDLGAFKDKYSKPEERSILNINKTGIVRKGGNLRSMRQ